MFNRYSVTPGARIMVPAYPVAYLAIGLSYVLQSPIRTESDVFDIARDLMPVPLWGVAFIVVAVLELVAMALHDRRLYLIALIPGAALAAFWAALIGMTPFFAPVTFSAGVWLLLVAVGQGSLARSLARAELVCPR